MSTLTAVRNYMFYNLAGEMMDYAPNVRYCEVIVDGVYQGLYLLRENVTGEHKCMGHIRELRIQKPENGYNFLEIYAQV